MKPSNPGQNLCIYDMSNFVMSNFAKFQQLVHKISKVIKKMLY